MWSILTYGPTIMEICERVFSSSVLLNVIVWPPIGIESLSRPTQFFQLCTFKWNKVWMNICLCSLRSVWKTLPRVYRRQCLGWPLRQLQYIPRNMHTVFALLCFVVVIHWLIFPYPSGLLHWHCGNLTIAPVPAKQPWWIWINTSCEFIMNDCITTTKQSTTKPCAYFLGYTVGAYCQIGT